MTKRTPFAAPPPRRGSSLRSGDVSELTTNRLSVYLRCLDELAESGVTTISSQSMADRFDLNSAQIRKDLANFGEFGIRGVGYDVARLRDTIVRILGLDRVKSIVIVGAGNLGQALADFDGFKTGGFRIVALFDNDRAKAGKATRTGVPIHSMEELEEIAGSTGAEIGILAVPPSAAQAAYDRLCDTGLPAILNFSPVRVQVRPGVKIKSVDLKISLEALSFYLTRKRQTKKTPQRTEGEGRA